MRSRICSSSLLGCQPTLSQLTEIWELTLRGIENHEREISITHLLGDNERVVSQDLDELVREAGSPDVLDNLTLSAKQDAPHREVLIQVGPGWRTLATIEAEDHTWAIGRHTEVMEKLSKSRKWYAPGAPKSSLSWPAKRNRPPSPLRRAIEILIAIPLALAGAFLAFAIALFYLALIIEPTTLIVQRIKHHQIIPFGGVLVEVVSLAVICATLYAITITIMAGTSKVIIHRKKFWTPNRAVLIGTLAGVVGAAASVMALLK